MPRSSISSLPSGTCRIEWRPSRWPLVALLLLAVAAPAAVMASAVPEPRRAPLAALAGLWALVLARRERQSVPCVLDWPGGRAPARLQPCAGGDRSDRGADATAGVRLHAVRVEFRGPLVRLLGRDDAGCTRRLLWWPDTLSAEARRRLALAARAGPPPDNPLRSMAA